ncbi:hypothetical protein EDF56_103129 [Novosphingobium sp. PhB165]|uniref:hypothetical protein n=1 Tax=Novosphingobium sp. PhB165 TaxID=2485105 RepID=UPI001046D050|nr:hypothetical protein [Novosphingobium sp. PhB165]TCM19492.1 hypothetical protein EDF56_103129 [Novosphingobium sp. PhB165]
MSKKLQVGTILLTVMALAMGIAWACLHRGPWYDEFYTQYVTRPGPGWGEALRTSWLADNHPPLYYALARATAWMGSIQTHRLLNLAIGVACLLAGVAVVRDVPRLLPASAVLLLLLAGNEWTVLSASELRSYFLSLGAGTVLALSLSALSLTCEGGSRARRLIYFASVLVAFNTHIVTTLIAGALIAPFIAAAVLRRDWTLARAVAVPALAAGGVFIAISLIQLPYWQANTRAFWIPAGFGEARWSIEYALLRSLEANPLVLLGALAGVLLMGRDLIRNRTACTEVRTLALLATGVMAGLGMLVVVHLLHPMLIEKYLTAMVGAVSVGIALACGRLLRALGPKTTAVFLGFALLVSACGLVQNVGKVEARYSWYGTGGFIAREVHLCPGTVIHTDRFWNADVLSLPPADNLSVAPWAYREVAGHFGFAIEPETSRKRAQACPTLFWAEHDSRHRLSDAAILVHLRQSGFAVDAIEVHRIGDGWVAVSQPGA